MYGYEIEIKDDASFQEKMNVFKVILPILQQPESETGLTNKDETIKILSDQTIKELDLAIKNNILSSQFKFYDDKEFYKTVFGETDGQKEIFKKEIIEKLASLKELKSYIEAVSLFTTEILSEEEINNIDWSKYHDLIKEMNILSEEDLPKKGEDFRILNFIESDKDNNVTIEDSYKLNFASLIRCMKDDHYNYYSVITDKSVKSLVDSGIISINSFSKMFNVKNDDYNLDAIKEGMDKLELFLSYYIDTKVTTKEVRKKFINILNKYKNDSNPTIICFMEALNNILLDDNASSPNRDAIKADWMKDSLDHDAGLSSSDDDGFF